VPADTQKFKVAVAHAASVAFERKRTLERVRQASPVTPPARARGWFYFPKRSFPAYPRAWILVLSSARETERGREDCSAVTAESSVECSRACGRFLGQDALENRIYLVIGVVEREGAPLLHRSVLCSRWKSSGQAQKGDAHRFRKIGLGLRRRLHDAGV